VKGLEAKIISLSGRNQIRLTDFTQSCKVSKGAKFEIAKKLKEQSFAGLLLYSLL
jgi:hypothetical protein